MSISKENVNNEAPNSHVSGLGGTKVQKSSKVDLSITKVYYLIICFTLWSEIVLCNY